MADNFAFLNETATTGGDEHDDESNSTFDRSLNNPLDEDYYTFLNLPRNAKTEDIQMQYRKLSKIYHPDKHSDPEFKSKAEMLFNKLKHVHEVLMDPEKRAIYDTLGAEGLQEAQSQGPTSMELMTRYRTPMEIREEFERLQREKEEQRMERQSNPKGSITVNINASEIFTTYDPSDEEPDYYYDSPYIELTGFHFFQSIEAPITIRDTIIMSGSVSAENGRGKGNINAGLRKTFGNRASAEFEVGGSTNGMDFGFKGYSMIGSHYHTNCSVACQSTPDGLRPAMAVSLGRTFDEKSNGQLMWRAGSLGGLQTQYIWDNSITRFVASVHLGVPHSFVSCHLSRKLDDKKIRVRALVRGGTFGIYTECGIEKKVSQLTTLAATMVVGIPVGVTLRIKILRSNQSYIFPIHLCDQILPAPIVYGTITPLLLWVVVNKLFVEPYERERKAREKSKLKAQNKTRMAEKKAEADAAIELMKLTYARIVAEEETRRGLVITSAKYGRLISTTDADTSSGGGGPNNNDEIIDVMIPLQCLVKDSKLILHDNSKCNLPGFYDPIPFEEKSLVVEYLFRNKAHQVQVKDDEPISIPKESHQLNLPTT